MTESGLTGLEDDFAFCLNTSSSVIEIRFGEKNHTCCSIEPHRTNVEGGVN